MRKSTGRHVTVNLMGGLGNQLLQYATAQNLSQKIGSPLFLNTFLLSRSPMNSSAESRKLEITQFAYSGEIQNIGKYRTFASMFLGLCGWFLYRFPFSGNLWIRTPNFFADFDKLHHKKLHLTGFFTSHLYFREILPQLRNQIGEIDSSSTWFSRQLLEFESQEFYAIHVRRGDYENLTDHFGLLTSTYYLSAIKKLIESYGSKRIIVFSDDLSKAKILFQEFPYDIEYVEPSADSSALESLILMSKSSGLVIANSTFSWWAGILSKSSAPVLYPKPFLRDEKFETRDFFPENWISISHTF